MLNDKYYYGVHKTKNMNDGYMGSGKAIKRAIKKYGVDNFSKQIIKFFEDEDSAYVYEKMIVNSTVVDDSNSYNLTIGGKGGFSHIDLSGKNNPMYGKSEKIREIQLRPEVQKKRSISISSTYYKKRINGFVSPLKGKNNYWLDINKANSAKIKMSENHADVSGDKNTFYGKKYSKQSLNKMSNSHKNRHRKKCEICSIECDISNFTRWHSKCEEKV